MRVERICGRIDTRRLALEPLRAIHAAHLLAPLRRASIYRYLDESPPRSLRSLKARYRRLAWRRSSDRRQRWLNWALYLRGDRRYIGYVQATVVSAGDAYVAYVLSPRWWGRGLGGEAVEAMIRHLRGRGIRKFLATVEADNKPSVALLKRLGFKDVSSDRQGATGREVTLALMA